MTTFSEKMKLEIRGAVDKTSKDKLKALQDRIGETEVRIKQLHSQKDNEVKNNDFDKAYLLDKEIATLKEKLDYMRKAESTYELGACLTHEQLTAFREALEGHYDPIYSDKVQKVRDSFKSLRQAHNDLENMVNEEAEVYEYIESEGELYRARISYRADRRFNKNVGQIINDESNGSLNWFVERFAD